MNKLKIIFYFIFILLVTNAFAQQFQFAKRIGGPGFENAMGIAVDSSGNIIISGYFNDSIDVDPSANSVYIKSHGGNDVFLAKYDSAGNYLWAFSIGGLFEDFCYTDPVVDGAGNIYVCGYFGFTAQFNPNSASDTLESFGGWDGFIAKYNSAGNFIWAKQFGGIKDDNIYKINLDNNAILFCGSYDSIADLDPSPAVNTFISNGATDAFFGKIDTAGNFLFAKSIGGTSSDAATNITHDLNDNIVIVGTFTNSIDINPSAATQTIFGVGFPSFICKYDSSGNLLWGNPFNYSIPYGILIDGNNNILTCGNFKNTVDFDPGTASHTLTSAGDFDIYFAKYNASGNYVFAKKVGGTQLDLAYCIKEDNNNNILLTGFFWGTADFNPATGVNSLTSAGLGDIFFASYDTSGNYQNAFRIGAAGVDFCRNFTTDAAGNIFMAGGFEQTVDFDPGIGTSSLVSVAGSRDGYFAKFGPVYTSINFPAEVSQEKNILIFPNPFKNKIQVSSLNEQSKIEIADLTGRIVFHSMLNLNSNEFDLFFLTEGIYVATIYSGDKKFEKLLVKQ